MYAAAPVYQANFAKLTAKLKTLIGIEKMPTTDRLMESLNLGALLSWLGGAVGSILGEIVLVVIYVAFLLAEQRHLPEKIDRLASNEDDAKRIRLLTSAISKQVQTYVWIKTVVSILTGFVSYVILRLVGVDFAAVWALIIFLLNYVPTVGSALGVVFPALLTLVQFETLTPFVVIVVGLGTIQFVIGNVVEPALMGKSLNLSSFVIILSLTFWGTIWGIPGMLLCVPITVVFAIVCSYFSRFHWLAVVLSADGRIMAQSRNA
jgi:predicted PurR-regulated permease PerM